MSSQECSGQKTLPQCLILHLALPAKWETGLHISPFWNISPSPWGKKKKEIKNQAFWSMCRVSGSTLYESFIGFQLQFLCSAFAKCSSSLLSCFEKKKVYVIASLDQYSDGFNLSHSDNFLYSWPSGYLKHTGMTALPCLRCFSGGDFPLTGWSAGNKFTDVLMAEGWGTKEWWIKPLGHWQNNKVRFFSSSVVPRMQTPKSCISVLPLSEL